MYINLITKDNIIPILRVHMRKKTLKITNSWMNYPTKTKKIKKIQNKGIH